MPVFLGVVPGFWGVVPPFLGVVPVLGLFGEFTADIEIMQCLPFV